MPPLRDVARRYGLTPKKALGQNFLFDLNLTTRIARAAGAAKGVTFVEIGPGPGGLTRALLSEGAQRVIAVEQDVRCLSALAEIAAVYPNRLHVVAADARATNLAAIVASFGAGTAGAPARIAANLPYNIGTALLTRWIESDAWPPWFDRLTLMFQREVAERIVATPANRQAYGRLGVLCGWRTRARILFDIPSAAFTPPPKVISSLVELRPVEAPLACERKLLAAITLAAFSQRRKMLRQSLKRLRFRPGAEPRSLFERTGIDGTLRAEEIDVAGFVTLARAYAGLRPATEAPPG